MVKRKSPGRYLLFLAVFLATLGLWPLAAAEPQSASATGAHRVLVIALDAVPFHTVAELTTVELGERRLFRQLEGPVPLISTFPSTTSLAFAGILDRLGLARSPGYEAKFFDLETNRLRGGGPIGYLRIDFPWRDFWDWKVSSLLPKMMSGLHPKRSSLRAVERSLEAFHESDEPVFFVYYGATDFLSHLRSPAALEPVLRQLDRDLQALREQQGGRPFYTVLLSDHGISGGEPLINVRPGVERALTRQGLRLARRLAAADDVVFAPFGLVSSFVVFTTAGSERRVAAIMATEPGVDLCAARAGDVWWVESATGSARIRRRSAGDDNLWSYEPLRGDPLDLRALLETSGSNGATPSFEHPDRWWLQHTRQHHYPDPLYRIASGFELIDNPASVICSTAEGYMFGAARTEIASRLSTGRLRWTHGALHREASLGFLMSDLPGWQVSEAQRFDEALLPVLDFLGGSLPEGLQGAQTQGAGSSRKKP